MISVVPVDPPKIQKVKTTKDEKKVVVSFGILHLWPRCRCKHTE